MVCLRYIIVNALHKGDNKDKDDDDDDDDNDDNNNNSLCHILMFSVIILFKETDRSTTEIQRGLYWKKWTGMMLCIDPQCILQVRNTANAVLCIFNYPTTHMKTQIQTIY
jgi:hypothetical protein